MTSRRVPRGFTLVELMMVVGVIGILSSVAIPELTRVSLRARTAERRTIMTAIASAVSDVTLNQGKIPTTGTTAGQMLGDWNPGGTPGTGKRQMSMSGPGWNMLALSIDGSTYYSYKFLAIDGAQPTLDVSALGDLDGDGATSPKVISYVGFGHAFAIRSEAPAEGAEDINTF